MPGREKNETRELEHPSVDGTRRFGAVLCKTGVCSGVSEKEWEEHSSACRRGRPQVLCLRKDNLLHDTTLEILKRVLPLCRRQ